MPQLSYLCLEVWVKKKGNAVALTSQLVHDAVHCRLEVVIGPEITRKD